MPFKRSRMEPALDERAINWITSKKLSAPVKTLWGLMVVEFHCASTEVSQNPHARGATDAAGQLACGTA
jgi:hypothetical protein